MLIAQITDIHAAPDNDNLARLCRVLGWTQTLRPELIVVTGDLIDDDWHEGYAQIEQALIGTGCPFLALPGNSDNPAAMRDAFRRTVPWATPDALHFSETVGGVPIVGVDTTVAGDAGGDIAPHLDWLAATLASAAQPALVFTHHHLFTSGIAPIDAAMCRGVEPLAQRLAHVTPPLAFCSGHVHRGMASVVGRVPAYICGSVCPANPLLLDDQRIPPVNDPPALMIHDLRHGRRVSSHVSV